MRTAPDTGTGISNLTEYGYNLNRQLKSLTRPDGITINFDYDTSGRLFEIELPGGSTLNYVYNQNTWTLNNIITTDHGTLSFTYDGSLPTKTTWNGPIQGNVEVAYNNDFLVTSQNINGANSVSLGYNNDNQLTSVGALTLNYDTTTGMFSGSSIGNVTASVIARNEFGEIGDYRVRYNGSDIFGTQYTYDKLGRITDKTETTNGQTHTYHYDYDLIGQLTDVWKDGALSSRYDYDSNGNRTDGTYDAQDRMLRYGSNTYQYTANGELKQKVTPDGTTNYSYDPLGNLTLVTLPDGTKIDYVIDGANRRVGKKVNGALVQGFLYQDALKPVAELDGSGNVVARFVYGTSSIVPDYMVKNGSTYRIVSDHLGSVRMVVDVNSGQVVQEISYDEWGNITQDTNPNFQPFGFAGGVYDTQTGLVRFGARDYDAETGRWTAKDPIGFSGGDSDLYSYAGNDPINYIDSDGRAHILAASVVGGIYGIASTYISDKIQGETSNWREYVANAAGGAASGAASGAVAATTGNVWAASAANSAASMMAKKALCGEGFDWSDLGQFAGETALGGVAGKIAGKQVPRGPGREPTKFWSSLTGTIGTNTLWRQGGLQAIHEATGKSGWEAFKGYFGW